jgi:hypothetical protein
MNPTASKNSDWYTFAENARREKTDRIKQIRFSKVLHNGVENSPVTLLNHVGMLISEMNRVYGPLFVDKIDDTSDPENVIVHFRQRESTLPSLELHT